MTLTPDDITSIQTTVRAELVAIFTPALLTGLAKLQADALAANVVQLAGSTPAATQLRDEELAQALSPALLTAIGDAAVTRLLARIPLEDAVSWLANPYDLKTVPGWVLVRDRAGVERLRFQNTKNGRAQIILADGTTLGSGA